MAWLVSTNRKFELDNTTYCNDDDFNRFFA